jgi:hypothetical protein
MYYSFHNFLGSCSEKQTSTSLAQIKFSSAEARAHKLRLSTKQLGSGKLKQNNLRHKNKLRSGSSLGIGTAQAAKQTQAQAQTQTTFCSSRSRKQNNYSWNSLLIHFEVKLLFKWFRRRREDSLSRLQEGATAVLDHLLSFCSPTSSSIKILKGFQSVSGD